MWLFTRIGFFSVVRFRAGSRHDESIDMLAVRARAREDLERLLDLPVMKRCGYAKVRIHDSADSDYRFRIFVDRDTMRELARSLVGPEMLSYDNFKTAALGQVDDVGYDMKRAMAYHDVWRTMAEFQES